MREIPNVWHKWADNLHRLGVEEGAAVLLDLAGPLTLLIAQVIYVGQPLFGRLISTDSLSELTTMLEEPSQTKAFIAFLREAY